MPKSTVVLDQAILHAALAGLEAQRDRIQQYIHEVQSQLGHRRGRPPRTAGRTANPRKRRKLSAAGRKRIAEAARKRWAEWKAAGVKDGRAKKRAARP